MSPQFRLHIKKVAIITLVSVFIITFITVLNHVILHSTFSLGPSDLYDFRVNIIINLGIGVFGGIIAGNILVYINSHYFRKKSFAFAMRLTLLAFTLVYVVLTTMSVLTTTTVRSSSFSSNDEVLERALELFLDGTWYVYYFLWLTITFLVLFLLQVSDKFGPGMMFKFIKGQYHQPKKEERIFMFLDMKSSTTIAEQLGNEKYFHLLRDVFSDLTPSILNNEGEIYQYVGDEIVITWTVKAGARRLNCLNCFKGVKTRLVQLSNKYEQKYGVIPQFKAGMHCGVVMAGEIGEIKKDIIYSGDVLNTTARIQEQCNVYDTDFLISKDVLNLIENNPYQGIESIGTLELRGKSEEVEIFSISSL